MPNAGRIAVKRAGFTLVEAVIALMIMGVSIVGICQMIVLARESSDRARDHYIAINLARNRIERARTLPYSQIPLMGESLVVVDEGGAASASGLFRRSTVVSNLSAGLSEMVVTVEIMDRRTRSFQGVSESAQSMLWEFQGGL